MDNAQKVEKQKEDKEDFKAFKTKNGRTVFDGGGIEPDITTNTQGKFGIISQLKKENLFFNFITDYCTTHSIAELESFELEPSVF